MKNKEDNKLINSISSDTKKSMITRIVTALILAVIGVPCVILGGWFFMVLASFISVVSIWEILNVCGKKYPWYIWVVSYIFILSFIFWVFFQKNTVLQNSSAFYIAEKADFLMYDIRLSTIGMAFLLSLLFFFSIVSTKVTTNDVFYIFTMSLFIGIAIQSILFLRYCPQALAPAEFNYNNKYATCLLLVYVLLGVCFNDICAYFVGVLFGKHKMNPRVSPKKTWEGFIGGVILSAMITTGFALICDRCFNTPILKGLLDAEHWYLIAMASILMGISSVLGDLMFSLIKRAFNIKDFGKIFPGHGGVLDRFDSLLITSLLITVFISFIYYKPLWGIL